MAQNQVANVLENNTPTFYCDYCGKYLTHDSPSVRKTHNIDRKHKENVKNRYQRCTEEQVQESQLLHFNKERYLLLCSLLLLLQGP